MNLVLVEVARNTKTVTESRSLNKIENILRSKKSNMKNLISPINKQLLKAELTQDKFVRPTNKGSNEIYIVTAHDSPNVMKEIGRLRESAFRVWGGGTGEELDIDSYDFMKEPYKQLIVWNPDAEEIVGGYRYLFGEDVEFDKKGQPQFTMGHLFSFSKKFIKEYLPYTMELGRAFVNPNYQTSKMGVKSLFALDNLWDGLGALIHNEKNARYFVGKVTIYESYSKIARELLYEYMFLHCPDPDKLIRPKKEYKVSDEGKQIAKMILTEEKPEKNYKKLQKAVRRIGTTIPPLFNAYIGLTDTMKMFGTMTDPDFSGVHETGIMLTIGDLTETKRKRYIEPYINFLKQKLNQKRAKKQATKLINVTDKEKSNLLKKKTAKRK